MKWRRRVSAMDLPSTDQIHSVPRALVRDPRLAAFLEWGSLTLALAYFIWNLGKAIEHQSPKVLTGFTAKMESVRVPSIVEDKFSPHAKETLQKVKKFVEEECMASTRLKHQYSC